MIYNKGIHNTVADALLCLDYGPLTDDKENWMTFNQCLNFYVWKCADIEESPSILHKEKMNFVFANSSKDVAIYALTVPEIADAQKGDKTLDKQKETDNYSFELVDSVKVLCKDGKLVIPKNLQNRAVAWYHHYLQHPGSTCLEETLWSGCIAPSVPTSKSAINVRSTNVVNINMENYHQNLL